MLEHYALSKAKYPPELKQQALFLAAGQSTATAARELALPPRTVQYWAKDAEQSEPGILARYTAEKRAAATKIALAHVEAATERVWSSLETIPVETAKDLQALSVSYGIAVDKMHQLGGMNSTGSTRFGTQNFLDGWSPQDKVTLERIERVTIDPGTSPTINQDG